MLQGKELILATKPFAKEIRWKSWLHALVGFALLTSFLLGTYFSPNIYRRIICSLCSALLLSRVFIIFHDLWGNIGNYCYLCEYKLNCIKLLDRWKQRKTSID